MTKTHRRNENHGKYHSREEKKDGRNEKGGVGDTDKNFSSLYLQKLVKGFVIYTVRFWKLINSDRKAYAF